MTSQAIPGLFTSLGQPQKQQLNTKKDNKASGTDVLNQMITEKNSLTPDFVHSARLLSEEISRMQNGEYSHLDPNSNQSYKVYISEDHQRKYNLVGRLLGPKGMTLKKMQAETTSRMSILGRGSMRQKSEEEKQRSSGLPGTVHLNEHLHVLVEVMPPHADVKLSAAVADVKKMLVPPVAGQPDIAAERYMSSSGSVEGYSGPPPVLGSSPRGPPPYRDGGRGPGGRGRGGGPSKRPSGYSRGGYSDRVPSRSPYNGAAGVERGASYSRGADYPPRGPDREAPPPRGRYGGYDETYGEEPYDKREGGASGGGGGRWVEGGGERERYGAGERGGYEQPPPPPGMDYRSGDPYSGTPGESDGYYSSFTDSPHPAAAAAGPRRGAGSEWKTARAKREPRHHPYTPTPGGAAGNYY